MLLQRGSYYVTLRCFTKKIERVAGHQGKSGAFAPLKNTDVCGINNHNLVHYENVFSPRCEQLNRIAGRNIFKATEKTVAMPSNREIAIFSRKVAAGDSANPAVEREFIRSIKNRRSQLQLRDAKYGERRIVLGCPAILVRTNAIHGPQTEVAESRVIRCFCTQGWGLNFCCAGLGCVKLPNRKS